VATGYEGATRICGKSSLAAAGGAEKAGKQGDFARCDAPLSAESVRGGFFWEFLGILDSQNRCMGKSERRLKDEVPTTKDAPGREAGAPGEQVAYNHTYIIA
jgi:hypothetical protein